jgi:hypothetical protein
VTLSRLAGEMEVYTFSLLRDTRSCNYKLLANIYLHQIAAVSACCSVYIVGSFSIAARLPLSNKKHEFPVALAQKRVDEANDADVFNDIKINGGWKLLSTVHRPCYCPRP